MTYAGCGADGCDHTPAPRRAWCSTCTEWCYPDVPCVRGQLSRAQAAYDVRLAELDESRTTVNDLEAISVGQHNELMRLRAQLAAVREMYEQTWRSVGHVPDGKLLPLLLGDLRRIIDRRTQKVWRIVVAIPERAEADRDALFTAIADAVAEWVPEPRDGWDTSVYSETAYRPEVTE